MLSRPNKNMCLLVALGLISACTGNDQHTSSSSSETPISGPYEPTEASLAEHTAAPDWFRDAKLGIYFHWGPYTVAEAAGSSEWYPRFMHFDELDKSKFPDDFNFGYHETLKGWHEENFGPLGEFGYHDMIPLFTGEHFDAEEWADLFVEAGARFAGPVAEHSDGYAMWDSEVTPWNAADTGPKTDIVGELFGALRQRNVKTIATFHNARNLQRYRGVAEHETSDSYGFFWDSHYPWYEGQPPASDDPALRKLYGNIPEDEWLETIWLPKINEVMDLYQPDILWFDSWLDLIPQEYHHSFATRYLNQAAARGQEVVIVSKQQDLNPAWSVEDFEKGRRANLTVEPWLTDDTLSFGSWSYVEGLQIKPLKRVLHDFVDIVSKNGQLLLNISPRYDGTIPEDQRAVLRGLGDWLKINGEAIYETRPWVVFGEGPTEQLSEGHFLPQIDYVAEDIRFTTRGDTLYAISLGTPQGELVIKSLSTDSDFDVAKVSILGSDATPTWKQTADGLVITLPDLPPSIAYTFKIEP